MGFIEQQVGLAQQAAKANEYDKLVAARDAEYMAQTYKQQGAQELLNAIQQAPLYAQNDELKYAQDMYKSNYNSQNIPPQVQFQVPAGATTNGARLQPGPAAPTSSAVADYLAQKEAWRRAQSKGQ